MKPYKTGGIKVHTEQLGGDAGARECFKNLTGNDVPVGVTFEKPYPGVHLITGKRVQYRPEYLSESKHPKIDIHGDEHEKITFIDYLRRN